jgi:hypothetical protein
MYTEDMGCETLLQRTDSLHVHPMRTHNSQILQDLSFKILRWVPYNEELNNIIVHTELLGFRTLSIVRILILTRKNNKHDVSETGSVSVLR